MKCGGTAPHLHPIEGEGFTSKRDEVIFDPLTKEDFTLANVPGGGRELTFIQEKGMRRVLDAEGAGALEIPTR